MYIHTSIGIINEFKPYAYQIVDGKQEEVACVYQLSNNVITFHFSEGFQDDLPLIIDPTVVAATLTGTAGYDNYGHTATYDNEGNIYAGGVSFGTGFPISTGAFQENYAGGASDVAIIKFNEDGSDRIYATYLGGSSSDAPHSMIVDFNNQLCVFGSTASTNYPVTTNAFQQNIGGGSDIFVTKLNSDGTALVGSTYLGGSNSDGINEASNNINYGETFRGEIVLDQQGNIYIASVSSSTNFPISQNAFQSTLITAGSGAQQDAVVCKLNSDLSTLFWSTYLGGDDPDTATGLRVNDAGQVYVVGTAGHNNFPVTSGTIQDTWPGGTECAYAAILSANGQQLLKGTFWGTSGDDHGYFTDIDEEGNIHIYGQTTGIMPITPNTYFFNEESSQFIAAFNSELDSIVYSTVIGNGSSFGFDFVPVAFMVDKCNGIYFSGYKASSNLPLTSDAVYTQGSSFYLAKLEPNATGLTFATYYGEADHVDGGTSRFDKSGIVYQGVCSCESGSFGVLNTLPNAWATGQTTFCDIGVFKIDFEIETVTAAAVASPGTSGCAPFIVDFQYTGQDATSFFWDFDDNSTSNLQDPQHTYTDPGSYTVTQIVNASNTCNVADTFYLQIDVLDGSSTVTDSTICTNGDSYFFDVSTANATYAWHDGFTGATYEVTNGGIYWVDVTIASGCSRRDSFIIQSTTPVVADLGPDLHFCDEFFTVVALDNPFAISYLWSTGDTITEIAIEDSGEYWVAMTDVNNCTTRDTIDIAFTVTPEIDLGEDTVLCRGELVLLNATTPGATYTWQDYTTGSTYPSFNPGTYWVEVNLNECFASDTIVIAVPTPLAVDLGPDDSVCDQAVYALDGYSPWAVDYLWSNGAVNSSINVYGNGEYWLALMDSLGCVVRDTVNLIFSATPIITLNDTTICDESFVTLNAGIPGGTYLWQDNSTASSFTTGQEGEYWVMVDNNGCIGEDTMSLFVSYPPAIVFTGSDLNCYEDCTGSIEVIIPTADESFLFSWNNGETLPDPEGLCVDTYFVTMTNEFNCIYFDTVMLSQPEPLNFEVLLQDVVCPNDGDGIIEIVNSTGGTIPYFYRLNQDSTTTDPYFSGLSGGAYEAFLIDANACSDSMDVFLYEPPEVAITAGEDLYIDLGDEAQINSIVLPDDNQVIAWTPSDYLDCDSCLSPVALPLNSTVYYMTVTDSITGCQQADQMMIQVYKPRPVFIPNVFSPNLDGTNDWFSIYADPSVREILSFKVFDRWGELLFERYHFQPNQETLGWNGIFKGKNMNPGVFVYLIEVAFIDDVEEQYSGDVMLAR